MLDSRDRKVRIGDTERNSASVLLEKARDGGYITLEEWEDRFSVCNTAKFDVDLREATHDLPGHLSKKQQRYYDLIWRPVAAMAGMLAGSLLTLMALAGDIGLNSLGLMGFLVSGGGLISWLIYAWVESNNKKWRA